MIIKRGLMKKQGQFYILAAMIIIAIIITLASLTNYAYVREKPKKFYDLSNNLNLEGSNIIKYGLYGNQNIDSIIQNLTQIFSEYIEQTNEDTDLVIITGNINNVTVRIINKTNTGSVNVNLGGSTPTLVYEGEENNVLVSAPQDLTDNPYIFITLSNNVTQNFTINPGQNFIFVLTKSEGFEQYVRTTEDETPIV
jgi:hypothetical protein